MGTEGELRMVPHTWVKVLFAFCCGIKFDAPSADPCPAIGMILTSILFSLHGDHLERDWWIPLDLLAHESTKQWKNIQSFSEKGLQLHRKGVLINSKSNHLSKRILMWHRCFFIYKFNGIMV